MNPLSHLAIIWAAVFVAATLAKKTRLTPVLYFLFLGSLLANIGVLPTDGSEFIRVFAELGIILIMFALGFEESTDNFLASAKRSWGIALFGAMAPFTVAYLIADYVWQDANIALMCGLAMTSTAVSLTMLTLRSMGLQKSRVALRIMTSTVLDAIGSLILVAIIVPLATGQESLTPLSLFLMAGKAVLFFVIVTLLGVWIFPRTKTSWIQRVPLLREMSLRGYLTFDQGAYSTLAILLVALVVGLLALYFGFHPAVGAYMAGLIVREEHFQLGEDAEDNRAPDAPANVYAETKRIVDNAAFRWIGPVFFVDLGAKILFDLDLLRETIPYFLAMTAGVAGLQIVAAGLAARFTAGMNRAESIMIGLGMLGRAELAFVVMDIAYVQYPILNGEAFFTLMATAFLLNVMVPVGLAWWRPVYLRHTLDKS